MKLKNLFEGLSKIVYHSSNNPLEILSSNTFYLSSTLAKKIEQNFSKKLFYFSTTRSKLGNYHNSSRMMILFKLDGDKLNQNYGGGAVDYWGRDFRLAAPSRNEFEDRLVTDKPSIPNAKKYILSVEIYTSPKYDDEYLYISKIIKKCLELNITINAYKTIQDFNSSKNPMINQDAAQYLRREGPELPPRKYNESTDLLPYIELIKTEISEKNSLSKEASDLLYKIKYRSRELVTSLKTSWFNDALTQYSRDLTLLAHKLKLRNSNDIIEYIKNKWIDSK